MTEPQIVIRAVDITSFDVLEGERAIVARVNTAAVDRLKTVIDPMGCDVSHFNKTQSVLWNHGQDPIRGMVPIGRGWVKVRKAERDMLGKTSFGKDDFSDLLYRSAKDGLINGWSIKAAVHEASPPTREELRAMPALEECEMVYRKWDLMEYSLAQFPGNSDCLSMMIGRGFITAPEGFVAIAQRYITHSGDKWIVHAEDGKVLGEHDNEADAKKQLAAVEAHKHEGRAWIDNDGSMWTVYLPSGQRCMAFADPELADECLRLLAAKPESKRGFYAAEAAQAVAETQRLFSQLGSEVKEYIDLYRHGRV